MVERAEQGGVSPAEVSADSMRCAGHGASTWTATPRLTQAALLAGAGRREQAIARGGASGGRASPRTSRPGWCSVPGAAVHRRRTAADARPAPARHAQSAAGRAPQGRGPGRAPSVPSTAAGRGAARPARLPAAGRVAVGAGTAVFVCGWCFSPNAGVRSLELVVRRRAPAADGTGHAARRRLPGAAPGDRPVRHGRPSSGPGLARGPVSAQLSLRASGEWRGFDPGGPRATA